MAGKVIPHLDRRNFLSGSGALVVGFSLASAAGAQVPSGRGAGAGGQFAQGPDVELIDSWLAINADNTATLYIGYVNLGQGGPIALSQIAADELDMDFNQIRYEPVDTAHSTAENTFASRTIGAGGPQLRAACAEARMALLRLAATKLKFPLYGLDIAGGVISARGDPKRSVTYGELVGGQKFGAPGKVTYRQHSKPIAELKYVNKRIPRPDIEEKARGVYEYVQHMRLPGMLHGRVVRPRGQGVFGFIPKVLSIDESSISDLPNVRVVRKGDFVGVVAPREWDAVRAAAQLKVGWEAPPAALPTTEGLWDYFRKATAENKTNMDIVQGDDVSGLASAPHVFEGTFHGPYLSHGTFAPNCALADVRADSAMVVSTTQGVYATRAIVAKALGLPADKVLVKYGPGSNTYGISCYQDVAVSSAIMSQLAGRPVRLQFMRWDEFGYDNYCPPHLGDVRVATDAHGKLVAFDYVGWSHGYTNPSASESFAFGTPGARPSDRPQATNRLRLSMNAMYEVPARRMIDHEAAGLGLLRAGYLRSPLDPHYFFAAEQAMDQIAHLASVDALQFRRINIKNRRWLGVLEAAANAANWHARVSASSLSNSELVSGRGIALGTHDVPVGNQEDRMTYTACVVEVQVDRRTGVVIPIHVYTAMDCGLAINPGNVEAQIISQACHGLSIALKEELQFSDVAVTSLDWNSYRTLRHGEAPKVTPVVLDQVMEMSSGAGEESLSAVVAATANAIFDATGTRLHAFPMTPERVLKALNEAGKAVN
jgi:nicotinate dehydrogenase subunit B